MRNPSESAPESRSVDPNVGAALAAIHGTRNANRGQGRSYKGGNEWRPANIPPAAPRHLLYFAGETLFYRYRLIT